MSLRDDLLAPIPGANPGGAELRYDPLFDKIKEARRQDDDAPQGEWTTALKTADWPLTIKLAKDAIATKSKDLQIAAWLTEALLRREGFAGLQAGLDLIEGLLDTHWDHLYPEIDDGDAEMRAAPLEWVGLKLDLPVRQAAIDKAGHTTLQMKESRTVPTEAQAAESSEKTDARNAAIANGKATPEDMEAGFTATTKAWYRALLSDVEASLAAVAALDTISRDKFGDVAPSYAKLREALEEVQRTVNQQVKRKLEIDPDPVDLTAAAPEAGDAPAGGADAAGAAAAGGGALAAEPTSRADATARLVTVARYLRTSEPHNPAAYLMLRGFRWGELRAGSGPIDPRMLEAPATNVRTNLKSLLLDARWSHLLEAAEGVMGTPQGRGWLDLQRYAIVACDGLGSDYAAVGNAIRGALRALLSDLPQLMDMTLMDDTATANGETRAWLRSEILRVEAASGGDGASASLDDEPESRGRDPLSLALAEVRSGRADRAIALLMREAGREKTSRGRFLLQAHLARIMVDAGHEQVAMPILEQLIAAVETHRLEEWEAGDVVAAPMALLYRVLEKADGDTTQRQALYLRICRLDPIQAMSFTSS